MKRQQLHKCVSLWFLVSNHSWVEVQGILFSREDVAFISWFSQIFSQLRFTSARREASLDSIASVIGLDITEYPFKLAVSLNLSLNTTKEEEKCCLIASRWGFWEVVIVSNVVHTSWFYIHFTIVYQFSLLTTME